MKQNEILQKHSEDEHGSLFFPNMRQNTLLADEIFILDT